MLTPTHGIHRQDGLSRIQFCSNIYYIWPFDLQLNPIGNIHSDASLSLSTMVWHEIYQLHSSVLHVIDKNIKKIKRTNIAHQSIGFVSLHTIHNCNSKALGRTANRDTNKKMMQFLHPNKVTAINPLNYKHTPCAQLPIHLTFESWSTAQMFQLNSSMKIYQQTIELYFYL